MKNYEGYLKRKLGDSYVLLAAGGHKSLSDFLGSIQYDSTNKKLLYKSANTTTWTDLITFGNNAFNSTDYVDVSGDTMTGALRLSNGPTSRSTIYLVSEADQPNDLWLGSNNTNHWSITSRHSSESNLLAFYSTSYGYTATVAHSTGIWNFGATPTVGGTLVSLNGHKHNFSDFNYPNDSGKFLRGDGNWSNVLNSNLDIFPALSGNYGDGIRIHSRDANNGWCAITFCASDNTGTGASGITSNSWYLGVSSGNFFIGKGATGSGNEHHLRSVSQAWECSGSWNLLGNLSTNGSLSTGTTASIGTSITIGNNITATNGEIRVWATNDRWHAGFGTSEGKLVRIGGSTLYGGVIGAYNSNDNSSPANLAILRDGGTVSINKASADYTLDVNGTTFSNDAIFGNKRNTNAFVNVLRLFHDSYPSLTSENVAHNGESSWGISFDRGWTSSYNSVNSAGIYAYGGGTWSTGLIFRVKNTSGGYNSGHNLTALDLMENGVVKAPYGFLGDLSGNSTTATSLSNTPNNTTTFLRGDNTWTNTLYASLDIFPSIGNYSDGLRLHSRDTSNGWCAITFCASDNTGKTGQTANSWYLGVSGGNFYIGKGGTGSGSEHHLRSVSSAWECSGTWHQLSHMYVDGSLGVGTSSPAYTLSVIKNSDVWHAQFGTSGGNQLRIGGSTSYGATIGAYSNDGNAGTKLSINRDGGNVGIGVANPIYKLDINGSLRISSGSLQIWPVGGGGYDDGIRIHPRSSDNIWCAITFCGTDNTGDSGTSVKTWFVGNRSGEFYINRNYSSEANASRLWGHSNGYTIGNTNTASYALNVGGSVWLNSELHIRNSSGRSTIYNITAANQPNDLWFGSNNTLHWSLTSRESENPYLGLYCTKSNVWAWTCDYSTTPYMHFNYNVYAPNFYTTSDRAKKQNISSFSEHIRKFQLKDTEKWHYGVIAQEVEEMFRDGEEGNMTVNYNSVLSYYIGCLENRVKELEEKVRQLEKSK